MIEVSASVCLTSNEGENCELSPFSYTRNIRFQLVLFPLTDSPHDRCDSFHRPLKLKNNPRILSALSWCLVSCAFVVWGSDGLGASLFLQMTEAQYQTHSATQEFATDSAIFAQLIYYMYDNILFLCLL